MRCVWDNPEIKNNALMVPIHHFDKKLIIEKYFDSEQKQNLLQSCKQTYNETSFKISQND